MAGENKGLPLDGVSEEGRDPVGVDRGSKKGLVRSQRDEEGDERGKRVETQSVGEGEGEEGGNVMDSETQSRLRAFLEVAGVKLSHVDTQTFQDPEILRKLTNW